MKRLFNLKSALWAGLTLFGVVAFTGCSKNDDNNDNGKNNGGFHVDEKLSELHMPVENGLQLLMVVMLLLEILTQKKHIK